MLSTATAVVLIAIPVFADPDATSPGTRLLSDLAAWILSTPRRAPKW